MPRRTTIPIYEGDDFERLAQLRQEVAIAERRAREESSGPRRMGDDVDQGEPSYVTEAKVAYDAFVDEAAERAEMWVLEAIGHGEYRELLKAHPPRKIGEGDDEQDDPEDAEWGVNTETFGHALLTFIDDDDDTIRTVVGPEFPTPAAMRKRIKRLSAGEFQTLWVAAMFLNRQGINDPKASRYSTTPRSSET